MRIMVRTLRGDRVALDVDGAAKTVAQAKGVVMARERVPVAMQRLFFAGCHLDDDDRTLAGYGVQHDSVLFLGLRLRAADTTPCHADTAGRGGGVGDLTGEDWSAIRAELNAATGSGFPVEELQRRVGEFRREVEAVGRIKSHPRFAYDPRRRVVVAEEADWKRYTLENPDAAAYEGRSPRLALTRAVFAGDGHGGAGAKSRESRPRRYLNKLLRSFGLRCKL
uniref:Uncharacterized protein n=1 Tax=Aegilops tauschii TaxID=37682 RepID=R7W2Z3_AEGTA